MIECQQPQCCTTTLYMLYVPSPSSLSQRKLLKPFKFSPLYIHVRPLNNWVNYSFKPQKYNIQYHIHININYIRCLCFCKWLKWIVIMLPQHRHSFFPNFRICAHKICWWNLAEIIWWRKNCFHFIRSVLSFVREMKNNLWKNLFRKKLNLNFKCTHTSCFLANL